MWSQGEAPDATVLVRMQDLVQLPAPIEDDEDDDDPSPSAMPAAAAEALTPSPSPRSGRSNASDENGPNGPSEGMKDGMAAMAWQPRRVAHPDRITFIVHHRHHY